MDRPPLSIRTAAVFILWVQEGGTAAAGDRKGRPYAGKGKGSAGDREGRPPTWGEEGGAGDQ